MRWLSVDGTCAVVCDLQPLNQGPRSADMWALEDLLMDPIQFPRGQDDTGDDAYSDSIIEAARRILEGCVRPTDRGGIAESFSESPMTIYNYITWFRAILAFQELTRARNC